VMLQLPSQGALSIRAPVFTSSKVTRALGRQFPTRDGNCGATGAGTGDGVAGPSAAVPPQLTRDTAVTLIAIATLTRVHMSARDQFCKRGTCWGSF
jgi:hypothetical protein